MGNSLRARTIGHCGKRQQGQGEALALRKRGFMCVAQGHDAGQIDLGNGADMRRMGLREDHVLGDEFAAPRESLDRIAFARLIEGRPKDSGSGGRHGWWRTAYRCRALGDWRRCWMDGGSILAIRRLISGPQRFEIALDVALADASAESAAGHMAQIEAVLLGHAHHDRRIAPWGRVGGGCGRTRPHGAKCLSRVSGRRIARRRHHAGTGLGPCRCGGGRCSKAEVGAGGRRTARRGVGSAAGGAGRGSDGTEAGAGGLAAATAPGPSIMAITAPTGSVSPSAATSLVITPAARRGDFGVDFISRNLA